MTGETSVPKLETTESLTGELRSALDGFQEAAQRLHDVTTRVGEHIPVELLEMSAAQGTEYEELHGLWVLSPGEEVFSLYGAHPDHG